MRIPWTDPRTRTYSKPNTVHLSTFTEYWIFFKIVEVEFLGRIGQLLILRLIPRETRRPRLETARSSRISSRTDS